jgi:hypothetical protein
MYIYIHIYIYTYIYTYIYILKTDKYLIFIYLRNVNRQINKYIHIYKSLSESCKMPLDA